MKKKNKPVIVDMQIDFCTDPVTSLLQHHIILQHRMSTPVA